MGRRLIASVFVFALAAAACTSGGEGGPSPQTSVPTPTPTESATATPTLPLGELVLPSSLVLFSEFTIVPLLGADAPEYGGPATPSSLEGVKVARMVRTMLEDPDVAEALTRNGFVVVPSREYRLLHFAYQGNLYEGWPVFVTTDAAYHVWHLAFDKLLRTLEQEVLLPKLERLVTGLLNAAEVQAADLRGTPLDDAASRVEQLYQVTAAELGLPVTLGPLAREEQALIDAHSAKVPSPIVGGEIDYSLFTPRGHYTRNEDLRRFFVAMSVLGQTALCLPGTSVCQGIEPGRMAVLASRVLADDEDLVALWRDIYEPTAFLVGLADDYTPLEVAGAARAAAPQGLGDPAAFADDALVQDVVDELAGSRPVRIDPERASIRLMGTRFVIDSFVLDQLIYGNVGTSEEPRLLPSALDLAAAFGSDFAYGVLEGLGETAYENYDRQLERMRAAIRGRAPQDWGGTVYDAWLHALEPAFTQHGEAYPDFMRTEVWAAKAHQAGLGSYAELKHDTILFTKQAMAEGGDGERPPERRNWVEPEPVVFGRLAAVADLMRTGLEDRDLLTREARGLLVDVAEMFTFFQRIAEAELGGEPISERDNERLTFIGGELEALWWRTSDLKPIGQPSMDEDAAIVADIASGGGEALEVGTGRFNPILVLVPDDRGTFQVAAGAVYSYYEFAQPVSERLTDEAWRAMLDEGEAPARPAWEEAMFPG